MLSKFIKKCTIIDTICKEKNGQGQQGTKSDNVGKDNEGNFRCVSCLSTDNHNPGEKIEVSRN